MLLSGPPCQDFSKLRLISKRSAHTKVSNLRPGLNGPHGRVFRNVIQILQWVLKHNPDCEFLIENVVFDDTPNDWKEICDVLGRSVLINCQSYSYTKRYRAYWTNFYHESDLPPHEPKLNPNECMIGNRTIIQYEACSRMNVRPLGARWKHGKSTSSRPIMVNDPKFEQLQHLLPEEAEALHGYQVGCTAGNDATADQRLKAIGNGWDLNVISMILSRSRLCRDAFIAKTMVSMHANLHPQDMAEVLMQLEPEVRQYHLHLLQ